MSIQIKCLLKSSEHKFTLESYFRILTGILYNSFQTLMFQQFDSPSACKKKKRAKTDISITFVTINGNKSVLHRVKFIVHFLSIKTVISNGVFTKAVLVNQATYQKKLTDVLSFFSFAISLFDSLVIFYFLCQFMLIVFFIPVGLQA